MILKNLFFFATAIALSLLPTTALAQIAGTTGADDLIVATGGATSATIIVSPQAGKWEKQAAEDLAKYLEKMSGAKPALAGTAELALAALGQTTSPLFIVGQQALAAEPSLAAALAGVAKKNPALRADAMVVKRAKNRVYLAGTNDEAHYYAVAWLLQQWGCRWYLPGEFGECIPAHPVLKVGALDHVYAPPFEVRGYWVAWNGEQEGRPAFLRRNFMNELSVPNGHEPGLSEYSKEAIPAGKTKFNVPFAEAATAEAIVKRVEPMFAKGESFSLSIDDGVYVSDAARDKELQAGLFDKYMQNAFLSDNMMTLYENVGRRLLEKHPASTAKIGFLAYTNVTIPPQRKTHAPKPFICYLAPIDIDPNHGMDDPNSPPRQEYREIMHRWAQVMEGRVVIYDYDQGQLVWRDLPNPSHHAFVQDVRHYRDAGILGVSTESRGAFATVFLNLFFRGQLLWNPHADVKAMLADFYPRFYGPAAAPMEKYWSAIYEAWEKSIVTEHEYPMVPAVYSAELVERLRGHMGDAEKVAGLAGQVAERVRFTRLSFDLIDAYVKMVRAAATEVDYAGAVKAGEQGLAKRLELAKLNTLFTTRVVGVAAETEANGAAWWPGEVAQYRALATLTNGQKGTLVSKLPLDWSFRRDPSDTGFAAGWGYLPADSKRGRNDPAPAWETLRADLYAQAQGVRNADNQSYTGYLWYRTTAKLSPEQVAGKVHLMFPGLFNEAWLYVNGHLVAHRPFPSMWWISDYKFEWDIDVAGLLQPGENTITVRLHNPHHFGGMFRRPFLYRAGGG